MLANLYVTKQIFNLFAGTAVGLKDWIRITFAADPSSLRKGMKRIKVFSQRHAREQ